MFVKIEKPNSTRPQKWLFLVHGLLDSHIGWNQVANRALAAGYGVVRVDLHGHARTLVKNHEISSEILSTTNNYKTNVIDVIEVLKRLHSDYGIERPYMVGHSYGGGIVTSVATHAFGKNLIADVVTVIAPYVYRIDGYQLENKWFLFGGLPFIKFVRNLMPTEMRARMESMTSDIYTDQFMTKLYTSHFTKLLDKRVPKYKKSNIYRLRTRSLRRQRLAEREQIIERHVQAAIDITKGIRDYDGREAVELLPKETKLNLILGGKDNLVPRELEIEFFDLLKQKNITADLVEFPGIGHMVINEAPRVTFETIDSHIHDFKAASQ